MKQRLGWIDIAKGIALLSVIAGHKGIDSLNFVYAYHLTVFFILSGYTMRVQPVDGQYLKSKFSRLMVPYFITCACVCAMDVLNCIIAHDFTTATATNILYNAVLRTFHASGWISELGNVTMGRFIGAIWFLPAMFFALVFTQWILGRVKSQKWQWVLSLSVAAAGCISAQIIWLPFSVQSAMLAVPFIMFGYRMRQYEWLEKIKAKHLLLFAAVFALGIAADRVNLAFATASMVDWLFVPIVGLSASLLVLWLCKRLVRCRPLEFVGRNSLTFLCIHLFELNTLNRYYQPLLDALSLPQTNVMRLILSYIVTFAIAVPLIKISQWRKQRQTLAPQQTVSDDKRDNVMDIMRALLIILMLVGHFSIDSGLRKFIYSFHMFAFVIMSGYFYKPDLPFKVNLCKIFKALVPYGVFAVLYVVFTHDGILTELQNLIFGISYSKEIFTFADSIGPIYFLLFLIVVRLLYVLLDHFAPNEKVRLCGVLILLAAGLALGKAGWWLPWSIDCAMVCVVLYYMGYCMRKYNVLAWCREHPQIYFAASCVWAFMVYKEYNELAVRQYAQAGLFIAGSAAAFIVVYLLCSYMAARRNAVVIKLFSFIGQNTIYILIIHTLFKNPINDFLQNTLDLYNANVFYLGTSIVIQLSLGAAVGWLVTAAKRKIKRTV